VGHSDSPSNIKHIADHIHASLEFSMETRACQLFIPAANDTIHSTESNV